MRSICIPHTELPGTSALFADYLYRFERVAGFYQHDPHAPDSVREAALAIRFEDNHRQRLVSALRGINGESAALDRLELPDTVAVVTGQQVGLFSGPAYTIYKALTAAKLARLLTESGIHAVPVFWLATEDHDFDEIDHCHVLDSRRRPVRLVARGRGAAGQPVGAIEIADAPVAALREALKGFLHADEVVALVEECYQPGRQFGEAFRLLLEKLLAGYGLVFIDPLRTEIRELAAPLLRAALERSDALAAELQSRGQELKQSGYHAQVLFEGQSSLFFELRNGRRLALRRNGRDYFHEAQKRTLEELAERPESLSPNALLRPVMQDYLLPTAAYIGGPAELAYLAQSQVLYKALLERMPVVLPRSGFTLLDERTRRLMDKHHLSLPDCFHGEERLREHIAGQLVPASLEREFAQAASETRSRLDHLQAALVQFDPTLASAMVKSKSKVVYQIEKIHRKAAREALRRDAQASAGAHHLSALAYPNHHLQERFYSILPFLAQHGFDLLDVLYENTHRVCPDHLLLTV